MEFLTCLSDGPKVSILSFSYKNRASSLFCNFWFQIEVWISVQTFDLICYNGFKFQNIKTARLVLMTGYVIQATEKPEFEDNLRTRVQLELLFGLFSRVPEKLCRSKIGNLWGCSRCWNSVIPGTYSKISKSNSYCQFHALHDLCDGLSKTSRTGLLWIIPAMSYLLTWHWGLT